MSSITENILRVGNITSSKAHLFIAEGKMELGFSAPAITYIKEKNIERVMGISLKQEVYSKAIAWGEIIELYVHEKTLGLDYEAVGKVTISHPTIEFWKGSPDNVNKAKSIVGDTKGYERKAYAEYADTIMLKDTEFFKKTHPQEYWQLVSNAIILGMDYIQPILFMPFKSELEQIRAFVDSYEGEDKWKYKYIYDASDSQLPYLPDGGYYKNLTTAILEVPQSDKDLLTSKIELAGTLLKPFYKPK